MPDYEKMYYKLFSSVTKAILVLQEAQRETAEILVKSVNSEAVVLDGEEA